MNSPARSLRVGMLTVVFLVLSCVTINVYFPAAEVEAAAEEIVEDVYSPNGADAGSPLSQHQRFWLPFGVRPAYADVDIDVSTPAIRAIRANLETRHAKLKPFYAQGAIGIGRSGYLELRDVSGLGLKAKGTLTKLLQADNTERRTLYREIVRANRLEPQDQAEVERVFAAQWRKHARAGWWIQDDAGQWARKAGSPK